MVDQDSGQNLNIFGQVGNSPQNPATHPNHQKLPLDHHSWGIVQDVKDVPFSLKLASRLDAIYSDRRP